MSPTPSVALFYYPKAKTASGEKHLENKTPLLGTHHVSGVQSWFISFAVVHLKLGIMI